MGRPTAWWLGLLFAAGAGYGLRPAPAAPSIGFVDLGRLLREHEQYLGEQQAINQWKDDQQRTLDQGVRELENKGAELDSFRENSDQWRELAETIDVEKARLEHRFPGTQSGARGSPGNGPARGLSADPRCL